MSTGMSFNTCLHIQCYDRHPIHVMLQCQLGCPSIHVYTFSAITDTRYTSCYNVNWDVLQYLSTHLVLSQTSIHVMLQCQLGCPSIPVYTFSAITDTRYTSCYNVNWDVLQYLSTYLVLSQTPDTRHVTMSTGMSFNTCLHIQCYHRHPIHVILQCQLGCPSIPVYIFSAITDTRYTSCYNVNWDVLQYLSTYLVLSQAPDKRHVTMSTWMSFNTCLHIQCYHRHPIHVMLQCQLGCPSIPVYTFSAITDTRYTSCYIVNWDVLQYLFTHLVLSQTPDTRHVTMSTGMSFNTCLHIQCYHRHPIHVMLQCQLGCPYIPVYTFSAITGTRYTSCYIVNWDVLQYLSTHLVLSLGTRYTSLQCQLGCPSIPVYTFSAMTDTRYTSCYNVNWDVLIYLSTHLVLSQAPDTRHATMSTGMSFNTCLHIQCYDRHPIHVMLQCQLGCPYIPVYTFGAMTDTRYTSCYNVNWDVLQYLSTHLVISQTPDTRHATMSTGMSLYTCLHIQCYHRHPDTLHATMSTGMSLYTCLHIQCYHRHPIHVMLQCQLGCPSIPVYTFSAMTDTRYTSCYNVNWDVLQYLSTHLVLSQAPDTRHATMSTGMSFNTCLHIQ